MKKTHLTVVLGVLIALITCPVQAGSIRDAKQAKVKLSDAKQDEQKLSLAKQDEEQSKKSSGSTLTGNDDEEKGVDCFYLENAPDPFCSTSAVEN